MRSRILIVDDEPDLLATVAYNLEQDGFVTLTAATGEEALKALGESPRPDLVLLDLMLPDMAGTEVCRRIRADKSTETIPVIMLTARGEEIDRVVGFEIGADDYVTKPFSVRELLLRVRAVLRRAHATAESSGLETFGDLAIDRSAHLVFVDGAEVDLTALEFKLLSTLASRRGRVQSRSLLLRDVWEYHSSDVTTRTVDTHIKRLREKLGSAGTAVETVRGVGYRFRSRDLADDA